MRLLLSIPHELISAIYEFLYLPRDILRFSLTNKYINTLVPKYLITRMRLLNDIHTNIDSMQYQQIDDVSIKNLNNYTIISANLYNYDVAAVRDFVRWVRQHPKCIRSELHNKLIFIRWVRNAITISDIVGLIKRYN